MHWSTLLPSLVLVVFSQFLLVNSDVASQRSLYTYLNKLDQLVHIRSPVTNKLLCSDEGSTRLIIPDESTPSLDVSLNCKEPLETWRIRQTVGFPFRDGKFSPVYKISSGSSTKVPFQFSQKLWLLKPSLTQEDEYQFTKPYEDYKCLSEAIGSQVITMGFCNDTTKNTFWKLSRASL